MTLRERLACNHRHRNLPETAEDTATATVTVLDSHDTNRDAMNCASMESSSHQLVPTTDRIAEINGEMAPDMVQRTIRLVSEKGNCVTRDPGSMPNDGRANEGSRPEMDIPQEEDCMDNLIRRSELMDHYASHVPFS